MRAYGGGVCQKKYYISSKHQPGVQQLRRRCAVDMLGDHPLWQAGGGMAVWAQTTVENPSRHIVLGRAMFS